jgi:ubiquinone/menaquinone biosynthesis C-methylase UbiE
MPDILVTQPAPEYLPDYLREVYSWAYLTPWSADLLDRQWVVQTILWGNAQKLINRVLAELQPGDRVLQPAAVYGDFSRQVAGAIGPDGQLTIRDIAALQVALTRRKLMDLLNVTVDWGDAAVVKADRFDIVACFFLLHEVPDEVKRSVTRAMLDQLRPGGKAIFVDYDEPGRFHPLKPVMRGIFRHLEPFATGLWRCGIESLAGDRAERFRWRKSSHFGGLYQVVIAEA